MQAAYTKTRELYTIDNTNRRLRVRSSWVTKRRTFITFPTFSIANTWRGASQIIWKFNFSLASATSITELFSTAPTGANFVPCISWKPTPTTIVRYKLWDNVGEILWAPMYAGEQIGADFSIEIWNTNNATISGGGYTLALSTLIIPVDFCDTDDIELGVDYLNCTDITFDPTNFVPLDGDYYVTVGTCGETQLIKRTTSSTTGWLVKATDNTWHYITLYRLNGITYPTTNPAATPPPGTREYLPLVDLISNIGFEVRLLHRTEESQNLYHLFIGGITQDADSLGALYLLANDSKYYGMRLRIGWDYNLENSNDEESNIQLDQDETIL